MHKLYVAQSCRPRQTDQARIRRLLCLLPHSLIVLLSHALCLLLLPPVFATLLLEEPLQVDAIRLLRLLITGDEMHTTAPTTGTQLLHLRCAIATILILRAYYPLVAQPLYLHVLAIAQALLLRGVGLVDGPQAGVVSDDDGNREVHASHGKLAPWWQRHAPCRVDRVDQSVVGLVEGIDLASEPTHVGTFVWWLLSHHVPRLYPSEESRV
mmetsp:Transcript_9281/g.25127  ORF Transcript_9281/g.25127 Transcript_9281/m.25127 type:complete len:211 (-) Transcript_9281:100-732(-)